MIFFPWTMDCSVGVAGFDNEHWQLMELINELYEGLLAGTATGKALDIVDGVLNYANLHLKHEEDAMVWADYPDAEIHRGYHDGFRKTVSDFRKRMIEVQGTLAMMDVTREFAIFIKRWLENHLFEEDKRLGQYLNARGVH